MKRAQGWPISSLAMGTSLRSTQLTGAHVQDLSSVSLAQPQVLTQLPGYVYAGGLRGLQKDPAQHSSQSA